MDEAHLLAAFRYVALNPVRAGLVGRAEEWPWSSLAAHLEGKDDALVTVAPLLERYPDFARMLDAQTEQDAAAWTRLRKSESTGRPVGSDRWLSELERLTGRELRPKRRGPKVKQEIG
jgi:putative transposase